VGKARLGHRVHQPLVRQAIRHELGDGDEGELVPRREPLRPAAAPSSRPGQDLADHAARVQPASRREIQLASV